MNGIRYGWVLGLLSSLAVGLTVQRHILLSVHLHRHHRHNHRHRRHHHGHQGGKDDEETLPLYGTTTAGGGGASRGGGLAEDGARGAVMGGLVAVASQFCLLGQII